MPTMRETMDHHPVESTARETAREELEHLETTTAEQERKRVERLIGRLRGEEQP